MGLMTSHSGVGTVAGTGISSAAKTISGTLNIGKYNAQGVLDIIYSDGIIGAGESRYYLSMADGTRIRLMFSSPPSFAFFSKTVVVTGAAPTQRAAENNLVELTMLVDSISLPASEAKSLAEPGVTLPTVSGTKKMIILLLKYSDDSSVPHDVSFYSNLINPGSGNTVNAFYQTSSWGALAIQADVTSWLSLPSPKNTYAPCGFSSVCANIDLVWNDGVTAGHNYGVNFANYDMISFVLSNDLDCCAWGGTYYTTLYGVTKSWGVTWMPPWSQHAGTYSHEVGHSIGLPHSGWVYYDYDSPWDVMSDGDRFNPVSCGSYNSRNAGGTLTLYCYTPGDIIAPYKDMLGWIDSGHLLTVASGTSALATVDSLAASLSSNYKMLKLCISGYSCVSGGSTSRYIAVEVRTRTGYDQYLPGEGVILHMFQGDRSTVSGSCFFISDNPPAYPIDSTPGDYGPGCSVGSRTYPNYALYNAQWLPGQTYSDSRLTISVLSRSGSTFAVSINQLYSASVTSNDVPSVMLMGQAYAVHVVMQNTGSNTWTSTQGYKLGSVGDNPPFGPGRVSMDPSGSIGPGQQYTFAFTITPTGSGTYTLRYQMLREGVTWFGQSLSVSVTVPAAYGATVVSNDIPAVMNAEQAYLVHVVMQNTGSNTWTAAQGYRLGFVGDNPPFGPVRVFIDSSASAANGQQYTFTFTLTAPLAPGSYRLQYQMLREGVAWFGSSVTVTVWIQLPAGAYGAVITGNDMPSSMVAGQSYTVDITAQNTGSYAWTAATGFRLGAAGDRDPFGPARIFLDPSDSIGQGQSKIFAFTVTAPAVPGSYSVTWQMLREGVAWFGAGSPSTVSVTARINAASIVANDIPTTMTAGQSYTAHVTVQNTGTSTWASSADYKLGAVGDSDPFAYPRVLLDPGDSIGPGQSKTFAFTMTAPSSAGSYVTDWRMLREGVAWFGQTLTVQVTVQGGAEPYGAAVTANDMPTSMVAGESYVVHTTIQNTGTNTWTAVDGYKLGAAGDANPFGPIRVLLGPSDSITTGQSKTFAFTVTAPTDAGTYTVTWRMLREGVTWFGSFSKVSVDVSAAVRSAVVVSNDVPTTMTAGQTYTVRITVQNTGTTTWTAAKNYKLGFVGDNPPFGPGRIYLDPSASVAPGQQYSFTFTITAPNTPGTYTMQYCMLKEGVAWFGQTAATTVTVQ